MDQKAKEELGRGLALEAILESGINRLVVTATLDIDKPETINNFNTLGLMLAGAYLKGQQAIVLMDNEQYRLQIAAICTAAIGYCTADDPVDPAYQTLALTEVQDLYLKYSGLHKLRGALRDMITDYYLDLDARKHGGVAMDHAFSKIERALGMSWHEHKQKLKG